MEPFDDNRVDVGGVDDRRGRGGGLGRSPIALGGGGVGIVGIVLFLIVNVLGGGGSGGLVPYSAGVQGSTETTEQLRTRCNSDGAIDQYDDCYVIKSYNEINEVWATQVDGYEQPRLVFFEQGTQTGCGAASSEVGPFYCPADQSVYIDLGFLAQLQRDFGAEGRYAQSYIVAHEVGHHLQHLLGTEGEVRRLQQSDSSREQALGIGLELQADCYAGVWSALANRAGNFSISEMELDQALGAAAAVGDDRIQQRTQGRVNPESWTHGSSQQRHDWFLRGYQTADMTRCDSVPLS
jgi:predicted metalloprotease